MRSINRTYKRSFLFFITSILFTFLWGCAVTPDTADVKSGKLPKPGATVAVGKITNSSGESFEFDVENLLYEAIVSSLQEQKIYSDDPQAKSEFVLSLDIVEYRQGNAFKRWLLPGYGSTVLSVRGELRDLSDETLIASIDHQRSVVAGGVYSIGAWKSIYKSVANDIAKDLKVKIEQGGDFVVYMTTRSEIESAIKPKQSPYTVKIAPLKDQRAEAGRIGERTAAFNVSMGDVHFFRSVPEFIHESLENEIHLMGYKIVKSGEDISITGEVRKFWIETDTTLLYWDMIGEIQMNLRFDSDRLISGPVSRDYACKKTERTYVWPTAELAKEVLDACFDEIMNQVRAEKIWIQ